MCRHFREPIMRLLVGAVVVLSAAGAAPLRAQSYNFLHPMDLIERTLRAENPHIIDWRGSRAEGDRTSRVTLLIEDSAVMILQWANAPRGGSTFNNEPRYEAAAYAFQRMFLPESEYVVPPTVLRAFPLDFVRQRAPDADPTFRGAASVLVVLQYWLSYVSQDSVWQPRRAETDTLYARKVGNLNVFTHLINHSDSNIGNILISQASDDPRMFSVDNGVAFRSDPSNRGTEWQDMRVKRIPASTVERLRRITREDLDRELGVLAEFEIRDGQLVEVPPGPNLSPGRGVRQEDGRVQVGLTSGEIGDLERRLRNLLRSVDRGRLDTF